MSHDIIGDIHGCSETLERLLLELGYLRSAGGIYRHPDRTVIFLGDFIDRGPQQREVISIVRPMIDGGSAQAVMGNHEYNAIAYATPDEESGGFLRGHSEKNLRQHDRFLNAYADEIEGDHLIEYSHEEPPVFLGHYWMEGDPEPLAPNIVCMDYSVAKPGGKLVAYRWNGERELNPDNFVAVERIERTSE